MTDCQDCKEAQEVLQHADRKMIHDRDILARRDALLLDVYQYVPKLVQMRIDDLLKVK